MSIRLSPKPSSHRYLDDPFVIRVEISGVKSYIHSAFKSKVVALRVSKRISDKFKGVKTSVWDTRLMKRVP